jgi:hypothetical protein
MRVLAEKGPLKGYGLDKMDTAKADQVVWRGVGGTKTQ